MSLLSSAHAQPTETAEMKKVRLSFTLDREGTPLYEVTFNGKPVVLPSHLGFVLNEDSVFYKGFQWKGVERTAVDTVWETVWGETRNIRDHYQQLVIHLEKGRRLMDLVFRVFEDGVGFRYVFPRQSDL
ncbi:MAG: glycoside hydrolase family 97 N-terminal domain-containing protein, partial [Chitinophaga rupis]